MLAIFRDGPFFRVQETKQKLILHKVHPPYLIDEILQVVVSNNCRAKNFNVMQNPNPFRHTCMKRAVRDLLPISFNLVEHLPRPLMRAVRL